MAIEEVFINRKSFKSPNIGSDDSCKLWTRGLYYKHNFGLLGLTLGVLYCEGGSRLTGVNHLGNVCYRPVEQVRFQIRGKQI